MTWWKWVLLGLFVPALGVGLYGVLAWVGLDAWSLRIVAVIVLVGGGSFNLGYQGRVGTEVRR